MGIGPQRGTHRLLQIAHIVHRIEDAKDVDAVLCRSLDERVYDVIGIVPVAEQILTAQQHLLGGSRHRCLELAQALPGVFAEVANAGVEGSATPGLQGPVADLVELTGDGQHVLDAHPGREQRLMGIT